MCLALAAPPARGAGPGGDPRVAARALAETTCTPASCTGNTLTSAKTCNGMGACTQGGTTAPCADDFVCSPTACYASCATGGAFDDAKCVSTDYCDFFGKCQNKLASGSFCFTNGWCQSNVCQSNVCM
ncbi:Flagellar hook-length control protein FliK [Minicystis rosea]|nr:Flagellar hook-length control protein FliK [Minicystis rosea]